MTEFNKLHNMIFSNLGRKLSIKEKAKINRFYSRVIINSLDKITKLLKKN